MHLLINVGWYHASKVYVIFSINECHVCLSKNLIHIQTNVRICHFIWTIINISYENNHILSLNLVNDLSQAALCLHCHQLGCEMSTGLFSQLSQTHQILADKHPDKNSEKDAADEPEDSEGIKLLWFRALVLGWLLFCQLTPQFHGIVETGQILLKASTRRAAEIVWNPLPPRSLSNPSDVIFQRASRWLTEA